MLELRSYFTEIMFCNLRGCFKSIRRLKPLLHKRSPPAWTSNLEPAQAGFVCVAATYSRQVKYKLDCI